MTVPTNAFTAYVAIGNREDLSDIIYRIDPTDTPFLSGIDREKADAVNHEWQTQTLAPAATNIQIEGDDVTADAVIKTTRIGNLCQISRKSARVTGTQRAVDHAGRGDEMAYQEVLKGLELKRDLEFALVGRNVPKLTGTEFTVARQTASVLAWLKTNTNMGTSGVDPNLADGNGVSTTFGRTDGTQRAFLETSSRTCSRKYGSQVASRTRSWWGPSTSRYSAHSPVVRPLSKIPAPRKSRRQ
jgi:hypothetical protein